MTESMSRDELIALIDQAADDEWTKLDLSSKGLTELPPEIGKLTNLTQLSLSYNQIKVIPVCLEKLWTLDTLDLRCNLLSISPEILGDSTGQQSGAPEKIFNYLRELRSDEKRQLNEAKLLFIGQGNVGKTSLINRLICNQYNPNGEHVIL